MTDTSKEVIERLRALQELDARIAELDREITSGPKAVESFQRAVAAADEKIAGLEERLKLLRAQVKLRENEAKTGQGKVDRLQEQALQVKTNREFTAMRSEISSAKADVNKMEEEILRIMEAVEGQEKAVEEAKADRSKEQGRLGGERAKVDAAIDGLRQRRAALASERPALTKALPAEALAAYDRVHKVRGVAMAAVVDSEYCGGCMERLTRNDVLAVFNSVRVVTCKSCSRLLFVER
jgi:uncharacterized protein